VPVVTELDPLQVGLDDLVEDPLIVADDDQVPGGASGRWVIAVPGVVEEHFRAVGIEPTRRERMVQPQLVLKTGQRRADALKGNTAAAHCDENEPLGQPHEGLGCLTRSVGHGG